MKGFMLFETEFFLSSYLNNIWWETWIKISCYIDLQAL